MHKSDHGDKAHRPEGSASCLFAAALKVEGGWHCAAHSHACTELVWYRGCRGRLVQDGQELAYRSGDVAVYQPGDMHEDACREGGEQICVGLVGAGAERLRPGMWRPDRQTTAAFKRFHQEMGRDDAFAGDRRDCLAACIVLEMRRQEQSWEIERFEPRLFRDAKAMIDTHFAQDLSIAEIADSLAVTPDYLRRVFVNHQGEPPVRYLIGRRLDAACDLLRLNQEPCHQIARRVGITNPYYFSRLFRKRFGETPTQYRQRYRTPG